MLQLILGSKSPQRKEIMSYFSLPFVQADPSFDEDSIPFQGDPISYVNELSSGKALSLIEQFPHAVILTADSIVFRQGKVYGKPQNMEGAVQMLSELAGQWHRVITGITMRHGDKEFQGYADTKVLFNPLTKSQIQRYCEKLHWVDRCGGYDIRREGGLLVASIEGCYDNVIGLPINTVNELLLKFGIELWNYLK